MQTFKHKLESSLKLSYCPLFNPSRNYLSTPTAHNPSYTLQTKPQRNWISKPYESMDFSDLNEEAKFHTLVSNYNELDQIFRCMFNQGIFMFMTFSVSYIQRRICIKPLVNQTIHPKELAETIATDHRSQWNETSKRMLLSYHNWIIFPIKEHLNYKQK